MKIFYLARQEPYMDVWSPVSPFYYTRGHIKRNIELFLEDSVFGLEWPDKR